MSHPGLTLLPGLALLTLFYLALLTQLHKLLNRRIPTLA
jgi:hypothetical protein